MVAAGRRKRSAEWMETTLPSLVELRRQEVFAKRQSLCEKEEKDLSHDPEPVMTAKEDRQRI